MSRRCRTAALLLLLVAHFAARDAAAIRGTAPARWIAHRDLFVALRSGAPGGERVVVILADDAERAPGTHPWEAIALQLAAPERVTVLPFRHALVVAEAMLGLPWLAGAVDRQRRLLDDPDELGRFARAARFTYIVWLAPEGRADALPRLAHQGFVARPAGVSDALARIAGATILVRRGRAM